MSTELEPSLGEKWELFKEERFPTVEKSELVDAVYEVQNLGPWDMNFAGIPRFNKVYGLLIFAAGYVVTLYAAWNFNVLLPGDLLDRLIVVAIAMAFVGITGAIWIAVTLNWGTFQRYVRIIDYVWRHIDRRPIRKGEFRVKRITQLWPMAAERLERYAAQLEDELFKERIVDERQLISLPNVGAKTELLLREKGFDSLAKVARATPEELQEIKGITDEKADQMIAGARLILEQELVREKEEKNAKTEEALAEEIDLEPMEKLSSTHRLARMVRRVKGITKPQDMRDHVREAVSLKLEFIRIVRHLDSKFTYSIMECEPDLYILVISRFSLTGGDEEHRRSGFVEFRDHPLIQRTYVYQGVNERGTWGVFTHLADYKYLEIPAQKYIYLGKEERVKHAPIAFLNYSDGQAELDDEQIRDERWTPTGNDILQGELVYGASVAEKLLEQVKLLTATVSRLKDTIGEIWREAMDWAKGVIAKAVEKILLEEKLRKEGGVRTWLVNLLSNTAMRYLAMLMALFGLYIVVAWIIGVVFPTIELWPWTGPEPVGPGDGPEPYNP